MYLNGDAYLITLNKTLHGGEGHFIVWDEIGGTPLMKIDHQPIFDEHSTIIGVRLTGETKDNIAVSTDWTGYDRRNSEVHGHHSFLLAVGCLVGRAHELRNKRAEERHGKPV